MARYYKDNYVRLNTCTIDEETKEIFVNKPTTFVAMHRELCDLFDDPDWMIYPAPTERITDDHGTSRPPWAFRNIELIDGTFELWIE